jgi:tetratricopeptide (TPR) repeat protein/DNA-binding CsgD family transcriptional regulator
MPNDTAFQPVFRKTSFTRFAKNLLHLVLFSCIFPSLAGETDSLKQILKTVKPSGKAGILNELAAKILEDQPEQTSLYAMEALKLASEYKNEAEEARAYYLLAESAVTMGDLAGSIGNYEHSAAIEKKRGEAGAENYANRLGDIGYCYYMMEQPLKALGYLQESLQLSVRGGFDRQAASMYSNIGSIYTEWGDYSKGLLNNQMALVIDKRSGDQGQVSTDLNNIGKIYEQWGKYDLAVKYYLEALEIAKNTGNQNMIAVRLNNLGIVYKAWKKYQEALVYFNEALEIDRSAGNMEKVGKRLAYIGATYLAMGNYVQCLDYLNQALPVIKKSELRDELARLYNFYGKYYLGTRNYPKAVEYFRMSQEYAVAKNLKPLQMGNLQGLSEAFEKSGQPQQSVEALKQFLLVKDSVFTAESDMRLAEFQARFDNEKMKLENDVLRKDVQMKHNVYLFSGILGLSLVLILLAVIFILRLKARNSLQAKELAERNATKFQSDLETKNRELAFQAISIIKSNEAITTIIEGLDKNIKNGNSSEDLDTVLNQIRHLEKDKGWKEFETHFTQVHSGFYQKLHNSFPDLTLNERKLCAFLRLNMTTKDIASITHQSVHSINVARTRLRRKMNLANSEENLVNFLINL